MPVARDHWWTAASDEEASVTGRELAAALAEYGLPELSKVPNARTLAAVWRAGTGPGLTSDERRRFLEAYERQTAASSTTQH